MLQQATGLASTPVTTRPASRSLKGPLVLLLGVLGLAIWIALLSGYQRVDWTSLRVDETTRMIFFQIRLPRVVLGVLVGASLAVVGAALQALFRNPLADPFTLGSRAVVRWAPA